MKTIGLMVFTVELFAFTKFQQIEHFSVVVFQGLDAYNK